MATSALPTLRVMTLNLNCDTLELGNRVAAAAEVVTQEQPDVLLLQEVLHPAGAPTSAEDLASRCGLPVVASAAHAMHARGFINGVAVLSSLPARGFDVLDLPDPDDDYDRVALAAHLSAPSGRPLLAVTTHLAWGGHREPLRQSEVVRLERWVAQLAPAQTVTVLGMDANAGPDSSTVRFLTGKEGAGDEGAYWVDAWAVSGTGPGLTSSPDNPWVAQTARFVGIADPRMIPARRIDYVLVRGWAHGRPGCPVAARVVGTEPAGPGSVVPSDHYAVVADLWDPPLA